ncbi:hypothetical protein CFN78_22560 [Amycolatopsis antarctica]|uniref:DUF418 domain-containing protein n=1 Tax=Amycolatopsis antarctica TaxID=1854586 RepID=A0A263CY81_9PSEU|nr:DUF418 domain-containing protein [Amycolatopsis antarctica]OZM70939.1 hypothetical protein CFN78_22560 [Amycolatopsis antarctica]
MTTDAHAEVSQARRGPVRSGERALAPDLARGAMLLIIALANSASVFFATAPGLDRTPHGAERVYNVFLFLFVHARGIPLFAIMFGYGLVQLARRQQAAGSAPAAVRRVLVRRNAWLLVFGLVHGILLFAGDILGAYGLVGIVFTLVLLGRGERVYRVPIFYLGFAALTVLTLIVVVAIGLATGSHDLTMVPTDDSASMAADTFGAALTARLTEWPMTVLSMLPFILFVWVGAWAARRRVLEEPANHLRMLRRGAVLGLGAAILGGLPMGLLGGGFLTADTGDGATIKFLYEASGFFGGIGYLCLFGLLAHALSKAMARPRENLLVGAVAALGQRSLSGYLVQTIAWLVLASPFMLALGGGTGSTTFLAAGVAVGVWLVSVLGAYLMQRRSYRGPAETLLRRLTYGPR